MAAWIAAGVLGLVFSLVLGLILLGGGPPGGHGLKSHAVPSPYRQWVLAAGKECPEVGPAVLAAQIEAESAWNPRATSPPPDRAQGIAQFMSATWTEQGRDVNGNLDGPPANPQLGSPLDPADAIMAQGRYMCSLLSSVRGYLETGAVRGDLLDLTLASYNAGLGNVLAAGGVPYNGETEVYIARIHSLQSKYAAPPPLAPSTDLGPAIVAAASSQIGQPYVWGGGDHTGPTGGGFDCSGLVMYALYQASGGQIALEQHLADWQATQGQLVTGPMPGSQVDLTQLAAGDIIAFAEPGAGRYHHIGIYDGAGGMVHAPTFNDHVKVSSLEGSYWREQTWIVRRHG